MTQPPPGYGPNDLPTNVQPPHPARINRFAVASLVLGLIAVVPFSAVLGIVALVQIKRHGGRGKGLAVVGLALTILWASAIAAGGVIVALRDVVQEPSANTTVQSTATAPGAKRQTGWLKLGNCVKLDGIAEGSEMNEVAIVGCDGPHDAEYYAFFGLKGINVPGDPEMRRQAAEGCADRLVKHLPDELRRAELTSRFYFHQVLTNGLSMNWSVLCLAAPKSGDSLSVPLKG